MPETTDNYTWHKVFSSAEEASKQVAVRKLLQLEVEGRTICLAHTPEGFFAINDACPHLGQSLSRGTTNYLNEVICPWHSYRYNLNNGRECDYRTRNAVIYPVAVRDDGVFIGIKKQEQ